MTDTTPRHIIHARIADTDAGAILRGLRGLGVAAAHFTNGVYAAPAARTVPTTLAQFEYVTRTEGAFEAAPALIIAVNSDKSMRGLFEKKIALGTAKPSDLDALENEKTRAGRMTAALALQFPQRKIIALHYDEETPNRLYDTLKAGGFGMKSLFKWGFGTDPQAGVIEGAENFERTVASPLPNDIKPLADELTRRGGQKGNVQIVDLRGSYISADNKILFPPMHEDLLVYARPDARAAPRPAGQHL